ncbi:MAG TPA: YfhO family protein [Thermoanaerobaculia bacterium]|nr:YfhO family protein [Thermoanaerobaculia bacterium]
MALLLFLAGGALIAGLVHRWRREVSVRAAVAYLALTAALFAVPLVSGRLQVATDIAYQWRPWRETVARRVVPANALLADIPLQMVPFRALVRERLLRLEAPLWAHELGTGQPLLGNAQSAPFAPLHLLALPVPPARALTVAAAWQVLLALLLTHALLLALGAGRAGAAFSAVSYALGSFAIAWLYYPLGMAAAWIPGVLLGIVLCRRGERGGVAGLVVCATGLALAGHPETLAHTALACLAVTVALAVRPAAGRGRFLLRLAAAAALAACLAAPVLLPVAEAVPESERAAVFAVLPLGVQPPFFEGRFLLPLVDPLVFGSPRDGNWSGPSNFNEMCTLYAGLSALALAFAGALLHRGRALLILAGGAAALMASLRLPPLFGLLMALPVLGQGAAGRLRLFWLLAVAVAAGLHLEELGRQRSSRAVAAAALTALAAVLVFVPPPGAPWQRAWWAATLAGAAVAALALLVPRWRPAFPPVAVACLALDLLLLGVRYNPIVPASFDLAPPPSLAFLVERNRGPEAPFRVLAEGYDLASNLPAFYGLWDPRGNDPMRPAAAARVVGKAFDPGHQAGERITEGGLPYPQSFPDYLGVRYLLTRHRRELPPPWEEVLDEEGGKVWRNSRALPLFFMPASRQTAAGREEAVRSALANDDFAREAVVEGETAPAVAQDGRVSGLHPLSNGFDLRVDSRTGGLVVSSVSYARGWQLAVDEKVVPVLRVNGGFLGFEASPGTHRARLDYRPAGWVWGLRLAGAGGAAALAALALSRRRRLTGSAAPR